jgi:hypothetical protein
MMPGSWVTNPWLMRAPEPVRGTRVWRAFFRDRASFTFGLWIGHDAEYAARYVSKDGDVISVEPVT